MATSHENRSKYSALFVGDIGFGEWYSERSGMELLRQKLAGEGYASCFRKLENLIDGADFVVGNLEAPLSQFPAETLKNRKRYVHWSSPAAAAEALANIGIDAVSVANNHALDCGYDGLRQTISLCRKRNIVAFGGGASINEASIPLVKDIDVDGSPITLIIFGVYQYNKRYDSEFSWYAGHDKAGVCQISVRNLRIFMKRIRESVKNPFFVIFPHWGADYKQASTDQIDIARRLIDAGADLIIGHGAHTIQELHNYAGKWIIYGIGNFVFNTPGRFLRYNAPPYGLACKLEFLSNRKTHVITLKLYPILTNNKTTGFESRPVFSEEFEESCSALLGDAGVMGPQVGHDGIGYYLSIPVSASGPSGGPAAISP